MFKVIAIIFMILFSGAKVEAAESTKSTCLVNKDSAAAADIDQLIETAERVQRILIQSDSFFYQELGVRLRDTTSRVKMRLTKEKE